MRITTGRVKTGLFSLLILTPALISGLGILFSKTNVQNQINNALFNKANLFILI